MGRLVGVTGFSGTFTENGIKYVMQVSSRGTTIKQIKPKKNKRTIGIKVEWKPLDGQQQLPLEKEKI
jgi:hypothetical protein